MSILKSPLTILGILVILTAGALGVAPWFIDWAQHKAEFQRQASLVTGRDVVISGPLEVRLFPWPRLSAGNVRISNPPGSLLPDFASIDRIEAEIAAPALLSGRIEFRKVTLLRPVVALERLASGGTSWDINPATSLKGLPGADQIAVAGIDIVDGQILLGDGRRGGLSTIGGVEGTLSAPALDGPWRIQLAAAEAATPFTLSASTGKYRPGQPLNVSVSITPANESGFIWSFDGEALRQDGNVKGKLTVAPVVQAGGKSNPLNSLWQVRLTGDITANFDTVALRNIEAVPATDLASRNLVTGEVDITLGQQLSVDARLTAASLDVDQMLGRNLFKTIPQNPAEDAVTSLPGALDIMSGMLQVLPQQTRLRFDTIITSMTIGGETLTKVRLTGQMSPEALRITEASASMPGQTRASFSGLVLPGSESPTPQLAGDVSLDSVSVRELAVWAMPDRAEQITQVWSGARGRARVSARLGWTPDTVRLSSIKARLDDANASGSFRMTRGETPSISVRLVADTFNMDRYAPRGLSASTGGNSTLADLTNLTASLLAFGDAQITVQTDSLVMRGVEARDIAVDVDISEGAVELRTIEIGGIGDARLDIAGVLNFNDDGIDGSVSTTFKATDPRPFLRLAGWMNGASSREPWARRLGPVDLKILSEVSTDANGETNAVKATLRGRAASGDISLKGQFSGALARWRDGKLTISAKAGGSTSADLVALAGLAPVSGGDEPASIELDLSGTPSTALNGTVRLSAFAGTALIDGGVTVTPDGALAISGQASANALDATPLMAALGLPALNWPDTISRALDARADIVYSAGKLQLNALDATLPANRASGSVTITGTLTRPSIDADLQLVTLDTGWLAGILTTPPAAGNAASTTFDLTRLGWLDVRLALQASRAGIIPGLAISDAQLALTRTGETSYEVVLNGQTNASGPLMLSTSINTKPPLLEIEGNLSAAIKIEDLLQGINGKPAINGSTQLELGFSGSGRTPSGLVSQLAGEGKLAGTDMVLNALNVPGLMLKLEGLTSVEGLDGLIASELGKGPLRVKSADLPLNLSAGILRTASTAFTARDATGTLRIVSDIAAAKTRIDVTAKATGESIAKDAPGLSMRLTGHPQALQRSYSAGALKTWTVTNVLQEGMERLEELQREEQRLIEEERAFREEQEAREAERRRRIIEERQAVESARRSAAEERERLKSAADARRRAAEEEQSRLKDLIQENLPTNIPADALLPTPPGTGTQPPGPAN